jgi:ribosomal protein L7Ae-like RNA K-turn-binding protein
MGVATGSKLVWTYFDVPKAIDTGKSTLVVIANGIASKPITISVSGNPSSAKAA